MNSQDAYGVLGLKEDASPEEIRKAYKDLILRCHPDKTHGGSSQQFMEVQEAYARLSRNNADGASCSSLFVLLQSMLTFVKALADKRKRDIHVQIPVSLEDIHFKRVKVVTIKVHRRGEADLVTQTFYIPLADYRPKYVFPGQGDECCLSNFANGDVLIHLDIEKREHMYVQDLTSDYDICYVHHVSLLEHYSVDSIMVPYFDETLDVAYDMRQLVTIVHNKGLPYVDDNGDEVRGDLYVRFVVDLPADIIQFAHQIMQQTTPFKGHHHPTHIKDTRD